MKIKKAKAGGDPARRAGVGEALIGNYRTVLKSLDDGGPAQEALAMTAEAVLTLPKTQLV
ncbi:hypothetical protein [Streptomyces sp. NPDC003032]